MRAVLTHLPQPSLGWPRNALGGALLREQLGSPPVNDKLSLQVADSTPGCHKRGALMCEVHRFWGRRMDNTDAPKTSISDRRDRNLLRV